MRRRLMMVPPDKESIFAATSFSKHVESNGALSFGNPLPYVQRDIPAGTVLNFKFDYVIVVERINIASGANVSVRSGTDINNKPFLIIYPDQPGTYTGHFTEFRTVTNNLKINKYASVITYGYAGVTANIHINNLMVTEE